MSDIAAAQLALGANAARQLDNVAEEQRMFTLAGVPTPDLAFA